MLKVFILFILLIAGVVLGPLIAGKTLRCFIFKF